MRIVTSDTMRSIDFQTIKSGRILGEVLMKRAGAGAAQEIQKYLENGIHENFKKRIVCFCGKGNNGGDGFVIATEMYEKGFAAVVYLACDQSHLSGDALHFFELLPPAVQVFGPTDHFKVSVGDVLIDCLLGTGVKSDLREPYLSLVSEINKSNSLVISIDSPTGLCGNTGSVLRKSVLADITLTIGVPKLGLFLKSGPEKVGVLKVINIGFPQDIIEEFPAEGTLIDSAMIQTLFKRKPHSSHKYNAGVSLIVGGSARYKGAASLASKASARAGSGMVTCLTPGASPKCSFDSVICIGEEENEEGDFAESCGQRLDEYINKSPSIVIGPGMRGVSSEFSLVEAALKTGLDVVIDAGALSHLAALENVVRERNGVTVLTPHTGELKRLAINLGCSEVCYENMAVPISKKLNVIVVLKGQFSRVVYPDGKVLTNSSGSQALATAGSGDVLAGIVGSLLCQFEDKELAVAAGVFIHGLCGERRQNGLRSMVADDLIDYLPKVLKELSPYC
ncbi:MAG: NAD(P)H-hydrate dehydratase [Lentisphaeraceae bacterium]|nr:NAD(P)H-hydrate dehydratase [Lentisphaeraceae bacterium]